MKTRTSKLRCPARPRGNVSRCRSRNGRSTSMLASAPLFADDRDILRDSTTKPYLFVILDTSGSMNWAPKCTAARLRGGDLQLPLPDRRLRGAARRRRPGLEVPSGQGGALRGPDAPSRTSTSASPPTTPTTSGCKTSTGCTAYRPPSQRESSPIRGRALPGPGTEEVFGSTGGIIGRHLHTRGS